MSNVDKTRSNIKINQLDDSERKELFGKFIEHGGKVITEKDERAAKAKASEKSPLRRRLDERIMQRHDEKEPRPDTVHVQTQSGGGIGRLFLKVSLYFDGLLNGVTDVSGRIISSSFLRFIDSVLLTDLLEAEALLTSTLYPVDATEEVTLEKQHRMRAVFENTFKLEMLERFREIYDEELYANLLTEYKLLKGNAAVTIARKREAVIQIFKRIYILRNYLSSLRESILQALAAYGQMESLDRLVINQRHAVIKKALDMVFYRLFPKLLVLVKILAERNFEIGDKELGEFIGMGPEDVIGFRTAQQKKEAAEAVRHAAEKKETGEEKKPEADQYAQVGLTLIRSLVSFDKEKNGAKDEMHALFHLDSRDKIYRAKLILDHFDKEYSLTLTTNKIKFNVLLSTSTKTDFGTLFSNSLSTINDVGRRIDDYVKMVKEIAQLDADRDMHFTQKALLTQTKEATRSKFAKIARTSIINFIRDIRESLGRLLLDKMLREAVIANPAEKLMFDPLIHGDKRINGYTALEALTETYYFICGFHYLLTQGELSGLGLLVDGEPDEKKDAPPAASDQAPKAEAPKTGSAIVEALEKAKREKEEKAAAGETELDLNIDIEKDDSTGGAER